MENETEPIFEVVNSGVGKKLCYYLDYIFHLI